MTESNRIVAAGGTLNAEQQAALDSNSWPLTAAQEAELDQLIEQNSIEGTLHTLVSIWGVLQALIAPLGFVTAVVLAALAKSKSMRLGFMMLAAASGWTIYMMISRDYIGSLGW